MCVCVQARHIQATGAVAGIVCGKKTACVLENFTGTEITVIPWLLRSNGDRVCGNTVGMLSLIHISEPTRPY